MSTDKNPSANRLSPVVRVALAFLVAGAVFVVGFGSGAAVMWFAQPRISASDGLSPTGAKSATIQDQREQGELLWEVWELLEADYIDPEAIVDEDMIHGAAAGMVASLGDPHTAFVEPASAAIMDEDMQGSFEGIGATVDMVDGLLVIVRPIPGSPAETAGVQAGDVVLAVNDQSLEGLDIADAISFIRGPRGTVANLLIDREGFEPFEIAVTRDKIELETVVYEMREDGIGYIRLTEFNAVSADQVHDALKELMANDPVGLVFDLRDNPGGYLHMSVQIASEFMERGTLVLTEKQRDEPDREFKASARGLATDVPLVVLVNGGSASASEIVAGSIQDNARGTLVGETTFGKGSVQRTHTLDDGSSLRVTIAKWLLPNGHNLDGDGIVPDILVPITPEDIGEGTDPQLDAAVDLLLGLD